MTKIMMIYSIPEGNSSIRISFNRRLFNYNIQTHKGKYKKKTQGILQEFERPIKSCIIFDKKLLSSVKQLCDEFSIKYTFYKISKISF